MPTRARSSFWSFLEGVGSVIDLMPASRLDEADDALFRRELNLDKSVMQVLTEDGIRVFGAAAFQESEAADHDSEPSDAQ